MKEAFDTMGNHPLLTLFLGVVLLLIVGQISEMISAFRKK